MAEFSASSFQSGVRFAAFPTEEQAEVLTRWIGCQRFIYNGKVDEDRLFAAQRRMELRDGRTCATPFDQQYAQFKTELSPWLADVPSQILRNGAVRWRTAKQRQLKGIARAPRRRNRENFSSVMVTSELFEFREEVDPHTGEPGFRLWLGTVTRPLGELKFKAHRPFGLPTVLTVTRESCNRWYVSFSYSQVSPTMRRTRDELAYELNRLSDAELELLSVGLDRNVRDNFAAASDGTFFSLPDVVQRRLERKAQGRKRYQRKLVRQKKGSKNSQKSRERLARSHAYQRSALKDVAHKVSHTLATSDAQLFVFEDLKIQNMVRAPKARQDAAGHWLPNRRKQKAGLNKAILQRAWGRTLEFTQYKTARRNKLALVVPPQYSSQECSSCGHTHPENRQGSLFVCNACGFVAHADTNAARVIRRRGIAMLREGLPTAKSKERLAFRRNSSRAGPSDVSVERV